MAMVFTFRVLENNARNYILQVAGVDASSTTAATQDGATTGIIAANGYTPTTHFKVRRILYDTTNCIAQLQWHATSNVNLALLSGYGDYNMTDKVGMSPQGLWNDGGAGGTGDSAPNCRGIQSYYRGNVTDDIRYQGALMAPRTIYANLPDGLAPFSRWDQSF